MERVDTIVVGAGIVGLAAARELSARGCETLVLEAENAIGTVTSSRNSGVIHAGIYYRPGSLKARLCLRGNALLYEYARARGIPYKNCGKLVVATSDAQVPELRRWHENARANGVTGIRFITGAEARDIEPEVFCLGALHVPSTGIIDQHATMLSLQGDAETNGTTVALDAPVMGGEVTGDGFILEIGGASAMQISCRNLVNAAGLGAQDFARRLKGLDPKTVPPQVLAKGSYFSLAGKPPFRHLIYPLPVPGSSGLHACLDLGGRVRFGPDVEWIDRIDYTLDPARVSLFEESIRRYWPGLPKDSLQPDYCGIRPKIARGSPHDTDFVIQGPETHGIPNLVNLYGIESPGLTSSLVLAEEVAKLF